MSTYNCLRTYLEGFWPMRTNLALFVLLALTAVACGGDSTGSSPATATDLCAGSGAAVIVDVKEYAFTPAAVTGTVGQSVCWANTGRMTHSVVPSGNLSGGTLPPGQTLVRTLFASTNYVISCGFHSTMTGTLVVNP